MFSRIIKNKNKPTKYTFILAAAVFSLVTGIGYIRQNVMDKDTYISGQAAEEKDITGSWIQPIPGMKIKETAVGRALTADKAADSDTAAEVIQDNGADLSEEGADKYQGFTLFEDGRAESINMHTLLVLKWRLEDGYLILTEKSIGNGSSSISDEKYRIIRLGQDKLQLGKGSSVYEYERRK